jgi:acyl-CoA synthetase (AMP-forming)/AMP-acid ligase II
MANFKVPRRITIVDQLPRNPAGKVQKFRLRADAGAGS